ncbi:polyadenylate-binding 2 [Olea europaea subsp. europaea]|uniref:Polyadenylate-binding 2 n=1 Tax=Olea europaea subsp. europaea TaxID=158383 RepID=A0A8S0PJL2_OLEEU|nr:polyadenylate-binding 2 [Olea europaea subsp. europaea]
MEGDDRTFRLNFTSEGVVKLRDQVTEKLKEFMGDYTDDTLVEYVIVLLKNGRHKDEAKNELNVFLGDDSDSFVSWLWDHLVSNLDLYVQPREPHPNIAPKIKSTIGEQVVRNDLHQIKSTGKNENIIKTPRTRHKREWKTSRDEDQVPPLRSSVISSVNADEEPQRELRPTKQSLSPQLKIQKKRRRPEERELKKEEVSQASSDAPRRLLQFAVRDAVATSRPSNLTAEPSLKRLRSVVSTSKGDSSLEAGPQRIRSVAGVRTAMSAAIKAVTEAAKDVSRVRSSGNVFDRLGRATDDLNTYDHVKGYREGTTENREGGAFNDVMEDIHSAYLQRNDFSRQYEGIVSSFRSERVITSDSAYSDEAYDNDKTMDITQPGTSHGNRGDHSLVVHYGGSDDADEIVGRPHGNQDQPETMPNIAHKIVSSSVTTNLRKPPNYQEVRKVSEVDSQKLIEESNTVAANSGVQMQLMKENNNLTVSVNGRNVKVHTDLQKESLKSQKLTPGLNSIVAPWEDADSRTIFVSNVHFAATKDSLSRHFNKFGEVLKVIILTDPASGQPKGSAYIEFMKKESAELALSLDGTSFMSRILKIARKSSTQPENASVSTWPRISRASPFPVPRFSRVPFARGIPNVYRARVPIKPGARSFQWKRDAQSTATEMLGQNGNSVVPSPTTRSLTYVRTEPKTNGGSSVA